MYLSSTNDVCSLFNDHIKITTEYLYFSKLFKKVIKIKRLELEFTHDSTRSQFYHNWEEAGSINVAFNQFDLIGNDTCQSIVILESIILHNHQTHVLPKCRLGVTKRWFCSNWIILSKWWLTSCESVVFLLLRKTIF